MTKCHIVRFVQFLFSLSCALSLLGCAAPLTLQSLHEMNPNALATRVCILPKGAPFDTHFLAYDTDTNVFVSDRDEAALMDFAPRADLLLEYDASAPPSSAKLWPISMGLSCPAPEPEAERVAISSEVHAELSAIIEQTCKAAALEGGDRQFIGQHSGTTTIVLGKTNPQFEARVRKLLGIEKIPEPEPSERAPVEARLREIHDFIVEVEKGAAAEAPLTFVPGGSIGADLAIQAKLLPEGTRGARIGRTLVDLLGGTGQIVVGCGGTIGGIGLSSTGGGAIAGVPMTVGSLTLIGTGFGNVGAGARRLVIEILRRDDGPVSSSGPPPQTSRPAAKPPQEAPPPAAKPPPEAPPAAKPTQTPQTSTTTRNKATGERSTKTGNSTTTTREKPAPLQTAQAKPNASDAPKAKEPHGNRVDDRPATRYEKVDADGNLRKHGVTKHEDPNKRYTKKQLGRGRAVLKERGPRKEMIKKERELVETNPGPENREPWAGKRKPPQTGGKDE